MSCEDLNNTKSQFLIHLFEKTGEATSSQVSMYDLGAELGLSRDEASLITTELMSNNLAEIRTLNGGICITDEGIREVKNLGAAKAPTTEVSALGTALVPDEETKNACGLIVSGLKSELNQLNLDFEAMGEIMSDLKTIDVQMSSPKPKTAILKECFCSIQSVLEKGGASEKAEKIKNFIGR